MFRDRFHKKYLDFFADTGAKQASNIASCFRPSAIDGEEEEVEIGSREYVILYLPFFAAKDRTPIHPT